MPRPLLWMFFLLTFAAAFALPRAVSAVCCGGQGATCEDGHETGQFECCGKGPCNIFCCNCDNGCRQPTAAGCVSACDSRMKICRSGCDLCVGSGCFVELCFEACTREGDQCKAKCPQTAAAAAAPVQFSDTSVWSRFDALDADKNGRLSQVELEQGFDKVRLCVPDKAAIPASFAKSDADGDGSLTPEEAGFPPRPPAPGPGQR